MHSFNCIASSGEKKVCGVLCRFLSVEGAVQVDFGFCPARHHLLLCHVLSSWLLGREMALWPDSSLMGPLGTAEKGHVVMVLN